MHKDSSGNIIGNGEDSAVLILKEMFPSAKITRQLAIPKLITNLEELSMMSQENKNRSVDILVETGQAKICIRVQNGGSGSNWNKHSHISDGRSRVDKIQKRDLEANGYKVVDLHQRDCPNLFKELVNDASKQEVKDSFKSLIINA